MTPKRTSLRPTLRNRREFVTAAWSRVVKARLQPTSVRHLRNGLLDVTGKCAEHHDMMKVNSETLLLRLPAEVRNRIWEYALGGKIFDVILIQTCRGRYVEEKTLIAPETFPENAHALLQVCRQIYGETALVPFSHNAFRFSREEAFDWARHLLPVQQIVIREVHVLTYQAERMVGRMLFNGHKSYMPDAFPIDVFPKVKKVVIKVGYHDFHTVCFLNWEQQECIKRYIDKITIYVKEARPNAELVFDHVYIKNTKKVGSSRKIRAEKALIYQERDERMIVFFAACTKLFLYLQQHNQRV